jgi:hypothetical protein
MCDVEQVLFLNIHHHSLLTHINISLVFYISTIQNAFFHILTVLTKLSIRPRLPRRRRFRPQCHWRPQRKSLYRF